MNIDDKPKEKKEDRIRKGQSKSTKIVNISELAKRLGISRARIYQLYDAGRIKPEYQDNTGKPYWSEGKAEKYRYLHWAQKGLSRRVKRVYE